MAGEPDFTDHQVKAAFIFNFGKFAVWPIPIPPSGSFEICILGENPFGDTMDSFTGRNIGYRPVRIRYLDSLRDIQSILTCQILFISRSERDRISEILRKIGAYPILTVADEEGAAIKGVMINLTTVDNKVRFEINHRAAQDAGINISSHLLKLATKVLE